MSSPPQTTRCPECRLNFSRVSNLRTHVKRKHPEKLTEICPIKTYNGAEICTHCDKRFVSKSNLHYHVKKFHRAQQGSLSHETDPSRKVNTLTCALCQYKPESKKLIVSHLEDSHNIKINIQELKFSGFEEFEMWKYQMEKDTKAAFHKMHGCYKTASYTRIRYSCHRSGLVRRTGTGQRRLKMQGSRKINGFCPASINVYIDKDKKCKCIFVSTHVGHNPDLGHLFLTNKERKDIAAKIASNIPFQNILDSIKESASNSQLDRLQLLKRKDLHNIKQCFYRNQNSVRHQQDEDMNMVVDGDIKNEETVNIVESLSRVKTTTRDSTLALEKQKVLDEFAQKLERVESFEELEIIKKIVAPIDPALDAVKKQIPRAVLMQLNPAKTPNNKTIYQRRLLWIKKSNKNIKYKILKPECSNSTVVALMNPIVENESVQ